MFKKSNLLFIYSLNSSYVLTYLTISLDTVFPIKGIPIEAIKLLKVVCLLFSIEFKILLTDFLPNPGLFSHSSAYCFKLKISSKLLFVLF